MEIRVAIPKIIVEPPLTSIANALNLVARSVVQVPQGEIARISKQPITRHLCHPSSFKPKFVVKAINLLIIIM